MTNTKEITAGGAIFARLKALGVDYVFANSGTDFPPIIEGLAEAKAKDIDLPDALVIPHEHAALGMAHGYYLMTGKAQAVMLHTNVGLSNGATGAINAACEHVPMFLMSGRTPATESGRFGARTVPIGWGQEMRDQAALVREACKWEYELKFPEQIFELLDRAYAISNSTPKGPVYLSLPRETLCELTSEEGLADPISMAPVTGAPDPAAIEQAAKLLASSAKMIHMGPDPLFSRFPVRNFQSNISISGETHLTIPTLIAAMNDLDGDQAIITNRRNALAKTSAATCAVLKEQAASKNDTGITKEWVSHCLGEVLKDKKSSVFSELGTKLGFIERTERNSWFQEPHSGGLGWSFPAALGAQLADREHLCIATLGDGSYMFANPTVCHQIAEALELPVLIIILNNEEWGAVRASVSGVYPKGYATKSNNMPLTSLKPSPDFTMTAKASRAWTKEVISAEDVPGAINEAIKIVQTEKRCALLNIKILPD